MNSEELEQSLRTEFESYLKTVLAEMRQEMSQLQQNVESEIEKHRSQLDQIFQDAFSRVNETREIDAGFKDSVVEHLRLARDEGARITATAIAEAEEMEKQKAAETPPKAGFGELREAINEISSKTSQSEILKSLVNHAANFAPRGAFFVVKNEHFVGWRKFGNEKGENEEAVREVFLPISADSILSEATRSLATVESSAETFSADAAILEKLEYGMPEKMYAIPLVARGRGVAVLYTDYGNEGAHLDTDALETMVKVAGLTVELLASAKPTATRKKATGSLAATPTGAAAAAAVEEAQESSYNQTPGSYQESPSVSESSYAQPYQASFDNQSSAYQSEPQPQNFAADSYSAPSSYAPQVEEPPVQSFEEVSMRQQQQETYPTYDDTSWNQPQPVESDYAPNYSTDESSTSTSEYTPDYSFQASTDSQTATGEYQFETPSPQQQQEFESPQQFDAAPSFEASQPQEPQQFNSFDSYAPAQTESYASTQATEASYGSSFETVSEKPQNGFNEQPVETAATAPGYAQSAQSAAPVRTRFSDRNVDLPIEVSEDERRLHNDARRFARLLVSEIKLYNEQKVKEGRDGNDLYDRLREAIDRSREMYDKRVQPSVAAKFDYFHYELINSLAEGEETKLGTAYPGAAV